MNLFLAKSITTGNVGVFVDNDSPIMVVNPVSTKPTTNVSYFFTLNRNFPEDMLSDTTVMALKCGELKLNSTDKFYTTIQDAIGVMTPVYTPTQLKDFVEHIRKYTTKSNDNETAAFFDCVMTLPSLSFNYENLVKETDITKLKDAALNDSETREIEFKDDFEPGAIL